MKKIMGGWMVLLFAVSGFAQAGKQFLITAMGARPDGITNNTVAIQKAIDLAAAAGGGVVLVPRGRFVTGVIHLKTNVELNIHEEAVLLASTDRADYGPSMKVSALIVAENEKNISLTGKGLIDGQCDLLIHDIYVKLHAGQLQDTEWKEFNDWFQQRPSEENRPRMIEFRNCEGVTVKNIHLQNGTSWIQNYKNCSNITIDSIHVFSNTFWNNDGIDLVDCKNARVTNSFINAADDGICLKSEDRNRRCENIYIANCRVRSSASAIKLGTASKGGFKKIMIRDIEVYDTYRSAVAIETVDGGVLEDIDVQRIHAVNTGNAVLVRLGHRNKDSVYGQLRNVHIAGIQVWVPKEKPDRGYPMEGPELRYPHNVFPASITGLPGHSVENVTLENISIVYEGGGSKAVNYFPLDSLEHITEAAGAYPEFSMFGELPAWGFYVRHAKGVTFRNVQLVVEKPDYRIACLFDDVQQLKLDSVTVKGDQKLPLMIFNKVNGHPGRQQSVVSGIYTRNPY